MRKDDVTVPGGQGNKHRAPAPIAPHGFNAAVAFLAAKLLFLAISSWSGYVSPIASVPPMTDAARLLALSFIGSSLVLTVMRTRLGFLSSLALGLLTAYSSLVSVIGTRFVLWSSLSFLTSVGLIVSILILWNRHGFIRDKTSVGRHDYSRSGARPGKGNIPGT